MNNESLKKFIDLVTFDQKMIQLQKDLEANQKNKNKYQKEIETKRERLEQIQAKETLFQKDLMQQEFVLKELQDKEQDLLKKIEKVSDNRMYDALVKELEYLRANQSSAEHKLLQMHNKSEALKKDIASSLQKTEEEIVQTLENIKEIDSKTDLLEKELLLIQKEREGKVISVSADWLEMYDLMKGRVLDPVVVLQQESCSACFYGLTPRDLQILKNNGLIQCKECYRILYEQSVP